MVGQLHTALHHRVVSGNLILEVLLEEAMGQDQLELPLPGTRLRGKPRARAREGVLSDTLKDLEFFFFSI